MTNPRFYEWRRDDVVVSASSYSNFNHYYYYPYINEIY
jgi:hypothetical protein